MSFLSVSDLARKIKISDRTIYKYLYAFPSEIKTQKTANGKWFIDPESFKEIYQAVKSGKLSIEEKTKDSSKSNSKSFQSEISLLNEENKQLHIQNNNLTDQLKNYALALNENKEYSKRLERENSNLSSKCDNLESENNQLKTDIFNLKFKVQRIIFIGIILLLVVVFAFVRLYEIK